MSVCVCVRACVCANYDMVAWHGCTAWRVGVWWCGCVVPACGVSAAAHLWRPLSIRRVPATAAAAASARAGKKIAHGQPRGKRHSCARWREGLGWGCVVRGVGELVGGVGCWWVSGSIGGSGAVWRSGRRSRWTGTRSSSEALGGKETPPCTTLRNILHSFYR